MSELKECPFCRVTPKKIVIRKSGDYTRCWTAGCPCNQKYVLLSAWNRRPPVDSVAVDIMERVKAECTKHQKGVGATGCNSCPLAGEGFNCVLDGPASHWDIPAMEAALADSTGEG